nr:hypothetical protein [uncultured Pedobacter sp.]
MAFRLHCNSTLYKDLGKYDAIVEFTEVAVRDFIFEAEKTGDFDEYLETKSVKHKVSVNSVDQSVFRARISHSYILSVYQSAELFLHQFREEHNDLYNKDWKLDSTTDNLLVKTIRQISSISSATAIIGDHRLAIFNYYRLIRNKYSHDRISKDKINQVHLSLNAFSSKIEEDYSGLKAPNDIDNISFDDFILFSRTIKDIADKISEIVTPSNEQLCDYYIRKDLYKNISQNKERRINAIKGHMREYFGIEIEQANLIVSTLPISLA